MEEQIINELKARGYILSGKRLIIIQELCRRNRIDSAEDFWLSIREQHGISWATVYTNLRLLVKTGLMEKEAGPRKTSGYVFT